MYILILILLVSQRGARFNVSGLPIGSLSGIDLLQVQQMPVSALSIDFGATFGSHKFDLSYYKNLLFK